MKGKSKQPTVQTVAQQLGYAEQLKNIELREAELAAEKFRAIEKAMRSDSPQDMIKAASVIEKMRGNVQDPKSFLIDPLQFNANLGYKDKPYSLSYTTLKRMSKTPIINSIIKTRKNQIADFAEPQENKYSTGFVIRKKPKGGIEQKMDKQDRKVAFGLTEFLLKGGNVDPWGRDDFDTFIRKIVEDSLVYDQMTFECIRNRRGQLESFMAVDGATFRMSESYYEKDFDNAFFQRRGADVWADREKFGKKVNGFFPSHVQVYQNSVVNEFYPWELCFGVRNPSTSINANGYGCSELEELINVVTSLLWGDEYNRRFFSQGSAPKGLLRVKGAAGNEAALQQFKQQWQSMITGVMQSWKTPVVEADVEWIDLQKNNRDMEYSSWMEYLIKLACAIYSIDPSEIGWDISRSQGSGGLWQGGQEERLQHSKDKGLYPLLKFLQRKINKYIIEQLNPDYELAFLGLNGLTIDQELKMDIDKVSSFMTVNEAREKYELPPLDFGDIPSNSVLIQNKNAEEMKAQNMQVASEDDEADESQDEGGDEDNPFVNFDWDEDEDDSNAEKGNHRETLLKAFDNFFNKELEYGSK